MEHTLSSVELPGTSRRISRLGLGAMQLSIAGRPSRELAKSVLRRAVEAGITLIDTADSYALDDSDIGHNERLIAETFSEMGLDVQDGPVVVATKGGLRRPDGAWTRDARPEHLREAVHASLRALGCDRITLYQLHAPDPRTPFQDSIGVLARMREEGKIGAIGLSNVSVAQVREASRIAPIASVQNAYSVWEIGYRRSTVVKECERQGLVFLAHSPLGGGDRAKQLSKEVAFAAVAETLGVTPQQLALAWLLHQSDTIIPIPGASRPSRIDENVRALELELESARLREIARAARNLPGHLGIIQRIIRKLARLLRIAT